MFQWQNDEANLPGAAAPLDTDSTTKSARQHRVRLSVWFGLRYCSLQFEPRYVLRHLPGLKELLCNAPCRLERDDELIWLFLTARWVATWIHKRRQATFRQATAAQAPKAGVSGSREVHDIGQVGAHADCQRGVFFLVG